MLKDPLAAEHQPRLGLQSLFPTTNFSSLQDLSIYCMNHLEYLVMSVILIRCIEFVTYPISIPVQIDELFLGDKLVMRKTRLGVKHVRERLVCYQSGHPDEQEVKEYISGKETLSSMLISSHS